jgi:predicted PurR-regulated permease PerM
MADEPRSADLIRPTLGILFLGVMVASTFWILRPFLTSMVWAAMIVVATWPALLGLEARLGGRRRLAVLLMTSILSLVVIVPIAVAVLTIVDKAGDVYSWVKEPGNLVIPAPPGWLRSLPVLGAKLADKWLALASAAPGELSGRLTPHAGEALRWLASQTGSFGLLLLKLALTVLLCAIFYSTGETAAAGVTRFARRLAGDRGENAVDLAGKAIRAVALGVVVTALVQSVLGGVGLFVCGVPGAAVLTAVIFMLCVAQIGPFLVLLPAVVWLYRWQGEPVWGTVLLAFTILVGTLDNFLRPFLIKKGVDLPILLIFAGVIGGLLGFGIIGLFIGPVVLAVAYTLIAAWVEAGEMKSREATEGE